jgi:hypothetical protein
MRRERGAVIGGSSVQRGCCRGSVGMLASLALYLLDDRRRFGFAQPMDRDGGRIELDPDAPGTDAIDRDDADRSGAGFLEIIEGLNYLEKAASALGVKRRGRLVWPSCVPDKGGRHD